MLDLRCKDIETSYVHTMCLVHGGYQILRVVETCFESLSGFHGSESTIGPSFLPTAEPDRLGQQAQSEVAGKFLVALFDKTHHLDLCTTSV
jgi:hypothetical protein